MATTAKDELRTYLSLRAPGWVPDYDAVRAIKSHGHTEQEIHAAAVELAEAKEIDARESAVRLNGRLCMMWRHP